MNIPSVALLGLASNPSINCCISDNYYIEYWGAKPTDSYNGLKIPRWDYGEGDCFDKCEVKQQQNLSCNSSSSIITFSCFLCEKL